MADRNPDYLGGVLGIPPPLLELLDFDDDVANALRCCVLPAPDQAALDREVARATREVRAARERWENSTGYLGRRYR